MIKIDGLKELNNALGNLAPNVEKRVLQSSVSAALRIARKEIKASAPRGEDPRSKPSQKYGPLYKNIKAVSRVRRAKKGGKGAKVTTGDGFWAVFYEIGTRHQPARPWFAPAFQRSVPAMVDELKGRLASGIEKEFSKMVKK